MKKLKGKNKILFIIIILSTFIILTDYVLNLNIKYKEENALEEFYKENKNNSLGETDNYNAKNNEDKLLNVENKDNGRYDYIAVLKIPKINLERGLVSINNKYNDVKYNVEILPSSTENSIILAAHSGTASNAYFNNLSNLKNGDYVCLFYNNFEYKYKITLIYDIEKTGKAKIIKDADKSTLILITCKQKTNMQTIYVAELI